MNEMSEKSKWQQLAESVSRGVGREAVEALEAYFETEKRTFLFRDPIGAPLAPDYNTLVLMAAVRDGQRQVISTLRHILTQKKK